MTAAGRHHRRAARSWILQIRFLPKTNLGYNVPITPKLTNEQAHALHASGHKPVEVVHPGTHATCVVVDGDTHRQALTALRRQQDLDAIQEGIDQMEAGEGIPLDEAFEGIRERLQLRQRQE